MNYSDRGWRRALLGVACAASLWLVGCNTPGRNNANEGAPKAADTLRVTTRSEAVINPDDHGRALPVTVRIYQLRDKNPLLRTGYTQLLSNDKEALGDSLIERFEYVAYPQANVAQELTLKPGARYVALLAVMRKTPAPAYYLIDSATIGPDGVTLEIGAQNMAMTSGPTPCNLGTGSCGASTSPPGAPSTPPGPTSAPAVPAVPVPPAKPTVGKQFGPRTVGAVGSGLRHESQPVRLVT